ncbi:MAG: inorganic phosphate transporter, PiT family [Solirubrobacteraceae bacterium]|nr:inorganic phosphate transporter, PiT family [Solirubrobacteraceae bacterium]
MHSDLVLVIVVGTALAFDFTNGFHDTANAVATSISTRAMPPRLAVTMAAILNFVGAFLSLAVAATIAKGIVNADLITPEIVFAGLIGAIFWNLLTWYFGLPSSSSHALIGGVVGSTLAAEGTKGVLGDGLVEKVVVPALVAPVLAFTAAGLAILVCYRIVGSRPPGSVNRGFRAGQIITGSLFSLSHGTNDAQKTMGIIFLALVANGNLQPTDDIPTWVILTAASAIALGTYVGGWRIIRTMGTRIIKMDPAQGFASQASGAAVILAASHAGFPLSTTHVISGGIMGAGAAKRVSAVRWGVAGNIVVAWVLTLPAAAAVGAATFGFTRIFGNGAAGPLVVSILLLSLMVWVFGRRLASGRPLTAGV